MAELGDRGQMLLIGAVVLAVTFVSLAVVLNGSIQTTTDASEASADVSASETVAFQNDVRRDLSRVMLSAYRNDAGTKRNSDQQSFVSNVVTNELAVKYGSRYERRGRIGHVGFATEVDGYYHHQDSSGDFAHDVDGDGSDEADWTLTSGSSRIRNFTVIADNAGTSGSPDFTIAISSSGGTSKDVLVYEDGSGRTVVDVDGETCTDSSSTTQIDVTAEKVGSKHCPALDFVDEMSGTYDVEFRNSGQIQGTYGVVTTGGGSGVSVEERLYAVLVDVTYRSPSTDYVSQVRVAPGEPS